MSYARVQPLLPLTSVDTLMGLDRPADDWKKQTRIQTTSSIHRIPTAQAIVRASVKPTVVTQRSKRAQTMIWPVFLCGFIAGIFGGIAVVKSPVGKKPAVQHAVQAASRVIKSF